MLPWRQTMHKLHVRAAAASAKAGIGTTLCQNPTKPSNRFPGTRIWWTPVVYFVIDR
jgi:hypothetical protein